MTQASTLPQESPFTKREQPFVDAVLKERAKASLATWVNFARAKIAPGLYMPTISFDLTGTRAGIAYWRRRHIRLNAVLLLENVEHFESDVIPHELAHLLCRAAHGKKVAPHGPEWKSFMRKLGVEPDRTHDLDTANSRQSTLVFGYACACNAKNCLSQLKHKRACAGTVYRCGKCKKPLIFSSQGSVPE